MAKKSDKAKFEFGEGGSLENMTESGHMTTIAMEATVSAGRLKRELLEARQIIQALLGISSLPQTEADKANARQRAIEFLKR